MSRTMEELKQAAKETGLSERDVVKVVGDISKEADVKRMVGAALKKFGTIDILVNNAGVIGPIGPTSKVRTEDWIRNIRTNVIGTFLCTHAVLPVLIRKRKGKIINIAGSGEGALANFSAYSASKSALIRFTETLAGEVRQYGIDVNAIAPGNIVTKMTREIFQVGMAAGKAEHEKKRAVLGSGGVPLELSAELAVFLASGASDGLTGKIISAVHDDWKGFAASKEELSASDNYTMRRIEPSFLERLKRPKGELGK